MRPGQNLSKMLRAVLGAGAKVEEVRATGDCRASHPLMPKPCRFSRHRKDAPRHLHVWLKRLKEKLSSLTPSAE